MVRLGGLLVSCWWSCVVKWLTGLAVETWGQGCEVGVGEMSARVGHSAIVVMRLIMESVWGTTAGGCCITPVVIPAAVRGWCVLAQT